MNITITFNLLALMLAFVIFLMGISMVLYVTDEAWLVVLSGIIAVFGYFATVGFLSIL